jgi:SAM-dependent methyltransferase
MMPLRSRIAGFLYNRTSLPFRLAFRAAAHARTRKPFRQFVTGDQDGFLATHTSEYYVELWKFGYHRMYDLVRHLDPGLDRSRLKVLSIGPRTEIELYYLWLLFGFEWGNIVGVDLVSASAKIELGDMGVRLPFPDNTFDVVVASHCLEKSRDPARTRDEIRRVARPGGYVCAAGNRLTAEEFSQPIVGLPVQFFRNGVYGLMESYGLDVADIDYFNARSPSGYEIIFRVSK